ncbi:hypothetical protein CR152_12000 [Massilia violaceinigra]|uniref:Uncharacterized protein n=1 Tax=Massilia violaceinigra TaxID=2045208 RepID=A0A2D2DJM1_9BURK|nr:hypothetical protein CR152_12000 [Massilia violaceinigra]
MRDRLPRLLRPHMFVLPAKTLLAFVRCYLQQFQTSLQRLALLANQSITGLTANQFRMRMQ